MILPDRRCECERRVRLFWLGTRPAARCRRTRGSRCPYLFLFTIFRFLYHLKVRFSSDVYGSDRCHDASERDTAIDAFANPDQLDDGDGYNDSENDDDDDNDEADDENDDDR